MKTCSVCGESKPITNFNKKGTGPNGTEYRDTKCRQCQRKERTESNLCVTCGRQNAPKRKQCSYCLDISNKSTKKRARLDRQAAFEHYGTKCAYCGEEEEIFLTIDHIENNGAEHRKGINGKNRGHNLPTWLRRNDYPTGFQTLCYNCNCAKNHHPPEIIKNAIKTRKKRLLKQALTQSPAPQQKRAGDHPQSLTNSQ